MGFTEGLGHSASTQGGGYRSREDQAVSPCFSHTHILQAPSKGAGPSQVPSCNCELGEYSGILLGEAARRGSSLGGLPGGGVGGADLGAA